MTESDLEARLVDLISRDAVEIAPYPAVALKISALLRRDDYGIGDLVKLVANDQALSARVLKVASSAMYGGSDPVSSVQAAVARLGAKEVSSLALASQLGAQARGAGPLASLKRRIWQESITSALLCQKLGAARRQSAEDSFTCGLLHDFGRMVTTTAVEKILSGRQSVQEQPEEFWTALVEKFHVELGLVMATRWNLSQLLCDVITLHHGEAIDGCENPLLLDAVMASDEIIALANDSPSITSDDLVGITGLRTPAERDLVAQTLPLCPALIATFEAPPESARAPIPSAVAAARRKGELHALALGATCAATPGVPFRATGIGANVLVLDGAAALALNRLVQITLQLPSRPITLWMNPQSCVASGGAQRIELKPFALNGEAAQVWAALLES